MSLNKETKTKCMVIVQQLSSWDIDAVSRVQSLEEAVCILQSDNALRKDMNPIILSSAVDK